MKKFSLGIKCRLVYEPDKGLEVHLKTEGNLPQEVHRHLAQAGIEIFSAFHGLAGAEQKESDQKGKERTSIEIEEV